MLTKLKERHGFTLIEVVIVLAIAALIILVVLQAVGAAQQSNRDTTRKQEAGRIAAILEQIASNDQGKYPAVGAVKAEVTNYDQPLGEKYTFTPSLNCGGNVANSEYEVAYTRPSDRSYTLKVCLEKGPSDGVIVTE